ncbi:MAG: hypothetical protein K9L30_00730 [Desulfobacterales bacterium]|nr:hypothetical protein [Desulfobacterales bacterium]
MNIISAISEYAIPAKVGIRKQCNAKDTFYKLPFTASLVILLFFFPNIAFAHNVSIFAWEEGDTVYTQSKFSGGKRVKGGTIIVTDPNNNVLLEGKTDDGGLFSFIRPGSGLLKIKLDAGLGHANYWELPALEADVITDSNIELPETINATENKTLTVITPDIQKEIDIAVEKALDKRLKPIMQTLADNQQQGPDLRDILGGLGYILGLMGMAAYFKYRKQNNIIK